MFAPKIPVTSASLAAIKAELIRTLPGVKSSHRCEAIARGLGFRTYASLLAVTRSSDPVVVTANGAAFSVYLADHGFNVSPPPFYRSVARVTIRSVLDKAPKLTIHGIGVGDRRRTADGKWENPQEYYARFMESRAKSLGEITIEEFLLSLAFLARVQPTKTIRPETSSYRLKHIAENYACTYPEGGKLGPQYVSNGAFIAAAIHAGFKYKIYVDYLGYESPNVTFNMSKRSLDVLDC